ncbi:hypothetical protein C8R44DRAFT_746608 [Mycena epipterygia]|nr:hypothetical protein C8R44DRAFT_746608 [Mycena epipterygia]
MPGESTDGDGYPGVDAKQVTSSVCNCVRQAQRGIERRLGERAHADVVRRSMVSHRKNDEKYVSLRWIGWRCSDSSVSETWSGGFRSEINLALISGTAAILQDNFWILLGRIEVKVPWVEDGDDYQLLSFLIDLSPYFTINGPLRQPSDVQSHCISRTYGKSHACIVVVEG